jgi:hypothetical protein
VEDKIGILKENGSYKKGGKPENYVKTWKI